MRVLAENRRTAWRLGLHHGLYCLGCCWAMMLLLFWGGVMSLAWIAALADWVLVEKFAPPSHGLHRAIAISLIGIGGSMIVAAVF